MNVKAPAPVQVKESAQPILRETRWAGALAVAAVLLLLTILPNRISLFPAWMAYALGVMVLVPMAGAALTAGQGRWEKVERVITGLFFATVMVVNIANLGNLVSAMALRATELSGLELLASSIWVWVTNVVAFSLIYWQLDRGGPGCRQNQEHRPPDWLFPEAGGNGGTTPGRSPTFVDYFFLAYSTATAFSATDTLPLTSRAKVLMMLESTVSLVTILVVASRAINILGG